ncbi:GID complex subunit containing RING finger motif [Thelotrema lepadinum]|nr:GID complex subunit containing RING finger motif [Thelotrema lepadinum]
MAEEFTTTKLNPDSHLLLEQPLLRLPYELSRKNFKAAQRAIEHERKEIPAILTSSFKTVDRNSSPVSDSLASIDSVLSRLHGLKRKLEVAREEEAKIQAQNRRRIEHLGELYKIQGLTDVKYEEWSRVRLNRLLVDYLLRMGYVESAKALAKEKGIEELVDVDVFVQAHRVEESLRRGSTVEALAWCREHAVLMKKTGGALDFELRLQQYIELRRVGRLVEAKVHAQRHLGPHMDAYPKEVYQATGLMAYPPNTLAEPYRTMYSQARWDKLAVLFVNTHHELFSLPMQPLLHIALSAGLSALKTPSCHSVYASSSSNARSSTTTVCPICSTELNELARGVPYAHHSKSFVENDPVVLPNGRIYGRERLMQMTAKVGLEAGHVKDPTTGEVFEESKVKKVFIS